MVPNASQQDLVYVSNTDSEVTVYSYSQQTLVGVLTDFTQPMGECVNAAGDVFIADYAAKQIVEYAHGAATPLKTLDDAPDSPYACSVDPTTGNLAVANDDGASNQGNVAIFPNASGTPTRYTDSTLYNFQACSYDIHGNLLVSNGSAGPNPSLSLFAWLPKGGSKLVSIRIPGPQPSWQWGVDGITWDGEYFVLENYYVYRVIVTHGQAYYVGETQLDPGINSPVWIYNDTKGQGTELIGGVDDDSENGVDYYPYPGGGEATAQITHGIDRAFGITISLAQ